MISKRYADFIILALMLIIAIAVYQSTADYPKFSQKTTAIYVKFLALSLGILCCLQLALSARSKDIKMKQKAHFFSNPTKFFALFIAVIIYASVMDHLGFFLSSALFIPVACFIMNYRNNKVTAIVTIGTLAFVYFVFSQFLGVPLPESSHW